MFGGIKKNCGIFYRLIDIHGKKLKNKKKSTRIILGFYYQFKDWRTFVFRKISFFYIYISNIYTLN
jgi:hypothetical protein